MEIFESKSNQDTMNIACDFSTRLKGGAVVALIGDLGAGKTAFVKGIARHFNSPNDVVSPTYTLVNEYNGDLKIYHFDVYRLDNPSIDECDWIDEYLFGNGICVIEWADNIKAVLPDNTIRVEINTDPAKGENYREIKIC